MAQELVARNNKAPAAADAFNISGSMPERITYSMLEKQTFDNSQ